MPIKKQRWVDWAALGAILILSVLYGLTLPDVPFHPDESTHIFMSRDIAHNPLDLAWDGALPLRAAERIRAIDAPLAKYLIGAIRQLFSIPPLQADWDWSKSWKENQSAGALPSARQLLVSRSVMALLLPISLWFFYLALKEIFPALPALAAVLLLGLNPLLLLHGRRAMSESPLVFGIAFFLWTVTREKRNPWLIGLAVGVAVNAKHSALGLLPAALLAAVLAAGGLSRRKEILLNILKTLLVLFLTLLLLNPFYWKRPFDALEAGIKARFSLASDQQSDHLGQLGQMGGPLKITIPGLLLNTYLTPPQTEEVGNYLAETGAAREQYLSNPFHTWGRDIITGSILAALSLIGLGTAFWRFPQKDPAERNKLLISVLATAGMGILIIFLLPWQRYAVALLPFTFLWVGAGLAPILNISPE